MPGATPERIVNATYAVRTRRQLHPNQSAIPAHTPANIARFRSIVSDPVDMATSVCDESKPSKTSDIVRISVSR